MQITVREPGSALTHFIGMILSMFASMPLLIKAGQSGSSKSILAITIFCLSAIFLYSASTLYHALNLIGKKLIFFKKLDHVMIFVLIAGSYTPICMIGLDNTTGYILLGVVWGIASLGMLFKMIWVTCPKWVSSVLYISLGWACLSVFGKLFEVLPLAAFVWLLVGGVIYTAGGIIYALKLSLFNAKHKYFGSHEIFHLFVMGGSFCHFICMYMLL